MSNNFDYLFDPDWSEFKIVDTYHGELEKIKNNPDDIEKLRQAFLSASAEHDRRITELAENKNILTME